MLTQAEIKLVARFAILRGVDKNREVGVVVHHAGRVVQQAYTRQTAKRFVVTQGDVPASRDGLVHVFQLQQAIGRPHLVHLAVDAGRHHGHLVGKTEVFQIVDALLRLGVVTDEGAALNGVECFRRMETQGRHVALVEHGDTLLPDAERMGRVVDHPQPVFVRYFLDGLCLTRLAVDMHGQDGRGPRRDGRLDFLGVDVSRRRLHIDENGPDAVPPERMGRRHEAIRRRDDLTRNAESLQRTDKRERAVRKEAHVRHTEVFRQRMFQLLMIVAVSQRRCQISSR